jgi:ElaB/YqjD/DUF883 family membrane-anchored ribosome-binding protein
MTNENDVEEKAHEAAEKVDELRDQSGANADAMLDNAIQFGNDRRAESATLLNRSAEELKHRTGQASEQLSQAGHKVADRLHSTADYVQEHSTRDMANEARTYAREHPVIAAAGGLIAFIVLLWLLK